MKAPLPVLLPGRLRADCWGSWASKEDNSLGAPAIRSRQEGMACHTMMNNKSATRKRCQGQPEEDYRALLITSLRVLAELAVLLTLRGTDAVPKFSRGYFIPLYRNREFLVIDPEPLLILVILISLIRWG